ncbi:hypothetical protein [Methylomonas sp. HYX-M1]|uniref:hypothetical protein n=1 Tax=Methylomonas sp. HYX-M1 TaxID=3139307 RepID=UPI00345BCDD0
MMGSSWFERWVLATWAALLLALWLAGLLLIGIGCVVRWGGCALVDWVMSFAEDFK